MSDIEPTPLDEVGLHGFGLWPGQWWACSQPERPPDNMAAFDGRCRACSLAAEAEVANTGDVDVAYHTNGQRGEAKLSVLVERSKRFLEDQT